MEDAFSLDNKTIEEIVKKEKIAVVGFLFPTKEYKELFSYRNYNNVYDKDVTKEIIRITEIQKVDGYEVLIVAQLGTSQSLKVRNYQTDFTILYKECAEYLCDDTEEDILTAFLKEQKVNKIIVITNTLLNLFLLRRFFQKAGFVVLKEKIRFNSFYKNFLQYFL